MRKGGGNRSGMTTHIYTHGSVDDTYFYPILQQPGLLDQFPRMLLAQRKRIVAAQDNSVGAKFPHEKPQRVFVVDEGVGPDAAEKVTRWRLAGRGAQVRPAFVAVLKTPACVRKRAGAVRKTDLNTLIRPYLGKRGIDRWLKKIGPANMQHLFLFGSRTFSLGNSSKTPPKISDAAAMVVSVGMPVWTGKQCLSEGLIHSIYGAKVSKIFFDNIKERSYSRFRQFSGRCFGRVLFCMQKSSIHSYIYPFDQYNHVRKLKRIVRRAFQN